MHDRINKLSGGDDAFGESVIIGGEFTPPVLVWTNDPDIGPSTTSESKIYDGEYGVVGLWSCMADIKGKDM